MVDAVALTGILQLGRIGGNDVDDAIALSMLINKHKSEDIKLGDYDLIGFASGIYMGKLHGKLIRFIKTNQSKLKNIFLVYTSGSGSKKYGKKIKKELTDLGLSVIDTFSCKGFDTYGPWKLIGGLAKKHPNENDSANYSLFIKNLQIKE